MSPDDAWVALDRNKDGVINDITEVFGSGEVDGFTELGELDSNSDGVINVDDERFDDLRVWQDLNSDGTSQEGELSSLADHGISALSARGNGTGINSDTTHVADLSHFEREDGTQGTLGDLELERARLYSDYQGEWELNTDALGLPWLQGYGRMPDLLVAMSLDEGLLNQVREATEFTDLSQVQAAWEGILVRWATGVDRPSDINDDFLNRVRVGAADPDTGEFGGNGAGISLQRLAVLAAFTGRDSLTLRRQSVSSYRSAWDRLFNATLRRFVIGMGAVESVAPEVKFNFVEDAVYGFEIDPADLASRLLVQHLSEREAVEGDVAGDTILGSALGGQIGVFETLSLLRGAGRLEDVSALDQAVFNHPAMGVLEGYVHTPFQIGNGLDGVGLSSASEHWLVTGAEAFRAGRGDDWLLGDEQANHLRGDQGDDYLFGGAGDDLMKAAGGAQYSQGLGGNDLIKGGSGDDVLDGGSGDDRLYGGTQNDYLIGGEGNDTLYGGLHDDVMEGGTGDDVLGGFHGADRYLFKIGDGQDRVLEGSGDAYLDVIEFGEGVVAADLQLSPQGNDLIVRYSSQGDQISIEGWYSKTSPLIELFRFHDGSELSGVDLFQQSLTYRAGDGDDVIASGGAAEVIYAGAGNDTVNSGAGDDTVFGETGDDELTGYYGNDTLDGGTGNDILWGENQNDHLIGGEGDDVLYGGNHDDLLDGGVGNDELWGLSGADRYLLRLGDGQDQIIEDTRNAATDVIEFGAGIVAEDLKLSGAGNDLLLTYSEQGDQVTIRNWYGKSSALIEVFRFRDGSELSGEELYQRSLVRHGTDGDDDLSTGSSDDVIYAGAGNDTVRSAWGDDRLYGEEGDDVLKGEGENDELYGGAGDDRLDGGAYHDVLVGGEGNDWLFGNYGNDVYRFDLGHGQDEVLQMRRTVQDRFEFGADIKSRDIRAKQDGSDLLFWNRSNTDQIRVLGWYGYYASQLTGVHFDSGVTWGTEQLNTLGSTRYGSEEAEQLTGTDGDDRIDALGGDDVIDGGAGQDTYLFGLGYGQDELALQTGESIADRVQIGEGGKHRGWSRLRCDSGWSLVSWPTPRSAWGGAQEH